jgi:hypothetical protein
MRFNSYMSSYQIQTATGTVHSFIEGVTYKVRGDIITNSPTSRFGKAVCGSTTSSAAKVTDAAVNCPKCLAA